MWPRPDAGEDDHDGEEEVEMISLVSLGVACILLIGVVLLRERYWRRRHDILEREYLRVVEENRRWLRSALRHDD